MSEPTTVPEPRPVGSSSKEGFDNFSHLLDARLVRSLATLGFGTPTQVQKKAIPLALSGQDILARARTGSGKTLAYGLPLLQKILTTKQSLPRSSSTFQATRALILVPTRELSEQVTGQIASILQFCEQVTIANIARDASTSVHKLLLSERPDVVVATPSRALSFLQSNSLELDLLDTLVIDEADLILSYGHDVSIRALLSLLRPSQRFLMSATMTSDVSTLHGLVLRNPAVLELDETASVNNLTQYYAEVSEEDKFLLTYVILKLRLIRGKCIVFVNEVDRCFRLRLFLEQFGLRSCVLNAELPINSRFHIVQEFNKGVYDYIIATDESSLRTPSSDETSKKRKRSQALSKDSDAEYGVSRGIDFIAVSCVINFDLPTTSSSYIHRVGRTARAGTTGTSLSFIVSASEHAKSKTLSCATTEKDEAVWSQIQDDQQSLGGVKEWKFDRKQVEAFRYRTEDALRSVTKAAIREARIKEIKNEILNSHRLKAHFEDNPTDLDYLRHDKALRPTRVQQHMKHVPSYLRPRIVGIKPQTRPAQGATDDAGKPLGYVAKHKKPRRGDSSSRGRGRGRGGGKKSDPLRKFGK